MPCECKSKLLPTTATLNKQWSNFIYLTGVKSYDVSLKNQTAEVITEESVDYKTVLEKIVKTGKKVKSGEADGKEMPVELSPVEEPPVEQPLVKQPPVEAAA